MIRCRLRTAWSFQAKAGFWGAFGAGLLVVGVLARWAPELWVLLLLGLALFTWFLRREQRNLQSLIVIFLDGVARHWGMTKVALEPPPGEAGQAKPDRPNA